jgi:hypothetical protein
VVPQKLPKKPLKGVIFSSFSTGVLICLNFIGVIYRQMRKKSEKKFMRVLRRKKKVVSLQSQTNGKASDWKRGSFGSSLKEWNGCSKQLEDFFETQR